MTIDQHGNKWRIRQMVQGKTYSITLDHKPTKVEAMQLMADKFAHGIPRADMTFEDAAKAYIASKDKILSPATKRGYYATLRSLSDTFKTAHIATLTALSVQTTINELTGLKSPKTVRNYASFIMAVLKSADVNIKAPQLPQRLKKAVYIPTEEDVRLIFQNASGGRYEVAFALAALGLRLSEICALSLSDLEGDTLHINKALVPDEHNKYVVKTTKTTDSTRDIFIPHELAEKIRQQGCIYDGAPIMLTKTLYKIQDRLGIPRFSVHKLRHFFASYMHSLGYTDKQIQEAGGWKTDNIMKSVYQHAMDMETAKKNMAGSIGGLFGQNLD